MPTFKDSTVVRFARGIKAFLNIEAGVVRERTPSEAPPPPAPYKAPRPGVRPENVVWLFGFGRSGSTWLSNMLGDMERHAVWPEPLIGELFGSYYFEGATEAHRQSPYFVLGSHRERWLKSIRDFFMDEAGARFPNLGPGHTLVVKEPGGSMGAPLLMEAMPESRMLLLVRDPRDVVASSLDAMKKESWGADVLGADTPDFPARVWAERYRKSMEKGLEAYEAHEGRKTLVRYEDLRAEPMETMRRLCADLGLSVDEGSLARIVENHSWENVPEDQKGEGKFFRKGTPGGWREDLEPEEIEAVEREVSSVIERFYT